MEVFRHQAYPLELVFEELKMKYPDIRVSFNMITVMEGTRDIELAEFEPFHTKEAQDIKFDIEPYVAPYKNGIDIRWKYRKSKFQPENIAFLTGEYTKMIEFFTRTPHVKLKDYDRKSSRRSLGLKKRIRKNHNAK